MSNIFNKIGGNISQPKTKRYTEKALKNKTVKNKEIINKSSLKLEKHIPKIVHQIWFGSDVPAWRQYLFDFNKKICKKNGYDYRLWLEKDRKGAQGKKNFPSTIGYQTTALEYGNSRWAQVADLARLEIIYSMGGIYLDSLFEISDLYLQTMTELFDKGYQFIGANEDPCGLDCVGFKKMKYLTNSFFAAVNGSRILERLIDDNNLGKIDLESEFVNRTTGPYYLRKGIVNPKKEKVYLFETEQIYPFNVNPSEYREVHPNTCLNKKSIKNSVTVPLKDKDGSPINIYLKKNCLSNLKNKKALVIYHSGLGGTWSF